MPITPLSHRRSINHLTPTTTILRSVHISSIIYLQLGIYVELFLLHCSTPWERTSIDICFFNISKTIPKWKSISAKAYSEPTLGKIKREVGIFVAMWCIMTCTCSKSVQGFNFFTCFELMLMSTLWAVSLQLLLTFFASSRRHIAVLHWCRYAQYTVMYCQNELRTLSAALINDNSNYASPVQH